MSTCPCGSYKDYSQCCSLFISGEKLPPTPEALMRSRYTAYTQVNIDYIEATMTGAAAQGFDPIAARQWAEKAEWLELQVIKAIPVTPNDKQGFVEFIAHYSMRDIKYAIHEISEFHLRDNRWYYVDGQSLAPKDETHKSHKIGRNDPCFCGSGKKYKKCCGH